MKKYNKRIGQYFIFIILLYIGIQFYSCNNSADHPDMPEKIELMLDEESSTFFEHGLQASSIEKNARSIRFSTNYEWKVEIEYLSGNDWCAITPDKGEAGSNRGFEITIRDNNSDNDRTAVLRLTAGDVVKTMNIIQSAVPIFELLTSDSKDIPAEGQQIEIRIKSNTKYSFEIDEQSKAWIIPIDNVSVTQTVAISSLSFKILPYDNIEKERIGTITFKSEEEIEPIKVTITQQPKEDKTNKLLDPGGNVWMFMDMESEGKIPALRKELIKDELFYVDAWESNKQAIINNPIQKEPNISQKCLQWEKTKVGFGGGIQFSLAKDRYCDLTRWDGLKVDVYKDGINQLGYVQVELISDDLVASYSMKALANPKQWIRLLFDFKKFTFKEGKSMTDLRKITTIRMFFDQWDNSSLATYYIDNIQLERIKDLEPEGN